MIQNFKYAFLETAFSKSVANIYRELLYQIALRDTIHKDFFTTI